MHKCTYTYIYTHIHTHTLKLLLFPESFSFVARRIIRNILLFHDSIIVTCIMYAYIGSDKITDAHQRELDRILQISFNPLSATMITDMDKVLFIYYEIDVLLLLILLLVLVLLVVVLVLL